MGLYDRDYMKRGPEDEDWSRKESQPRHGPTPRGFPWLVPVLIFCGVATTLILVLNSRVGTSAAPRSRKSSERPGWTQPIAPPLENREKLPLVNINTASLAELDAFPYISAAKARAIIDGRPYASPEDLLKVRGIGPATLERIRPLITFGSTNGNLQSQ